MTWQGPWRINADVILDGTFVDCSGSLTNVLNGFVRTGEVPTQAVNPLNGHVYFAWESGKSPDIFFSRSLDEGLRWSRAVRVHANARNDQFQPRLAVSESGTTIKILFYDRSADPRNWFIHVREATSPDDGLTWNDRLIDSAADFGFGVPPLRPNFDPQSSDCYMGDYNAIKGPGDTFYRARGDNRNDTSRYRHGPPLAHPDPDVFFARTP